MVSNFCVELYNGQIVTNPFNFRFGNRNITIGDDELGFILGRLDAHLLSVLLVGVVFFSEA